MKDLKKQLIEQALYGFSVNHDEPAVRVSASKVGSPKGPVTRVSTSKVGSPKQGTAIRVSTSKIGIPK